MSVNVRAGAQNCGKLDRCAETRPVPPTDPYKRYLHRSTKPAVNVTKSNLTWPSFHNHLCGGAWKRERGKTKRKEKRKIEERRSGKDGSYREQQRNVSNYTRISLKRFQSRTGCARGFSSFPSSASWLFKWSEIFGGANKPTKVYFGVIELIVGCLACTELPTGIEYCALPRIESKKPSRKKVDILEETTLPLFQIDVQLH